jgi:hypothetical protein
MTRARARRDHRGRLADESNAGVVVVAEILPRDGLDLRGGDAPQSRQVRELVVEGPRGLGLTVGLCQPLGGLDVEA